MHFEVEGSNFTAPSFQGRRLFIIGTSSCREVLEQLQMLSAFNTVIHIPSITKHNYLINVLKVCKFVPILGKQSTINCGEHIYVLVAFHGS